VPGDVPTPLFGGGGLRIVEEPFLTVLSVRRSHAGSGDAAIVVAALGSTPPAQPNDFTGDATASCAWVEPHAWWLVRAADAPIGQPIVPTAFILTDISDRIAAFRVTGELATVLLAAATAVGVTPQALASGRCAKTRFAEEVEVMIQQLGPVEFRVLIDAALAQYASDWLCDAARGIVDGPAS
jgi:heterotetrameric sarcosine oxidase gamma subunit